MGDGGGPGAGGAGARGLMSRRGRQMQVGTKGAGLGLCV